MKIYIEEMQNHVKTVKEYHLTIKGQDRIKSIFSFEYYNDDSNEDEVISDEKVLTRLFTRLNRFPVYLSFGFHELIDLEKTDLLSTVKDNGYYLISLTNLLKFEKRKVRRWFIKKERLVPVVDMIEPTTFFKISFDFENVLIFSNETDFDTLEKIEALFPDDEIER